MPRPGGPCRGLGGWEMGLAGCKAFIASLPGVRQTLGMTTRRSTSITTAIITTTTVLVIISSSRAEQLLFSRMHVSAVPRILASRLFCFSSKEAADQPRRNGNIGKTTGLLQTVKLQLSNSATTTITTTAWIEVGRGRGDSSDWKHNSE